MKADKLKQIKAHANAIAELLYEETDSERLCRKKRNLAVV